MDQAVAIQLIREALWLALIVPGPILLCGLLVGLVVSIFQAVTQIHEMTLVFIPKLIVTVLVIYVTGHWMLTLLVSFTARMLMSIPQVVR
jgi:flagellar biosynthetic protein FliQ